jgi:hypothetical protein
MVKGRLFADGFHSLWIIGYAATGAAQGKAKRMITGYPWPAAP